ncbi:gonadotropin-releasing hormone receptor-like [Argiope bruennichi]|uniref:gonadotropin-releasing hormone receptor-like n=1 Tax=Argiope bruennichi TaxID=94029 RepID=UPI0024942AB3|nr:gonadotropin-releasing hormone receptor-like [Argiope bruennichi]
MAKILLFILIIILANLLSGFPIGKNKSEENSDRKNVKENSSVFIKKFFPYIISRFLLTTGDIAEYPELPAPDVSILPDMDTKNGSSLKTNESDCVSLLENTRAGSNLSYVAGNCTPPQHAPQLGKMALIKGTVLSVISFFSFTGNVITLASVIRTKQTGTIYLLLGNLAFADLLVTFFCIFSEGMWSFSVEWYGGNVLCKVLKFMQMFSLYLSTFILVIIGFDRLWAVRYPMRRVNGRKNVRRAICGAWVLSSLFSMPQGYIFSVRKGPFIEEFYQCVTYGFYTSLRQEQVYTIFTLVVMFAVPLMSLIGTYAETFFTIAKSVWNSAKKLPFGLREHTQEETDQPDPSNKQEEIKLPDSSKLNEDKGTQMCIKLPSVASIADRIRKSDRAAAAIACAALQDLDNQHELSERITNPSFEDPRHRLFLKAKQKSLAVTLVIVLTFVVCWVPYYAMMLIVMFTNPNDQISDSLFSVVFFFGSLTALFNPIIYGSFYLRNRNTTSTPQNTSNSSRVEGTMFLSRRNKRRDETTGLQMIGSLSFPGSHQKKTPQASSPLEVIPEEKETQF